MILRTWVIATLLSLTEFATALSNHTSGSSTDPIYTTRLASGGSVCTAKSASIASHTTKLASAASPSTKLTSTASHSTKSGSIASHSTKLASTRSICTAKSGSTASHTKPASTASHSTKLASTASHSIKSGSTASHSTKLASSSHSTKLASTASHSTKLASTRSVCTAKSASTASRTTKLASTGSIRTTKLASSGSVRSTKLASTTGDSTQTSSTSDSSPSSTATCIADLSPIFIIDGPDSVTYSIGANNETEYAASPASATHFSIADVCDGPYCGIAQLAYNGTTDDGESITYGAYVKPGGAPITFFSNQTEAFKLGYFIVTGSWSSYTCRLVLIPFLNHEYDVIYDCGGTINLLVEGTRTDPPGCHAANLTYTAV